MQTRQSQWKAVLAAAAIAFALTACGGDESTTAAESPPVSAAAGDTGRATVQEISAEARSCIDLVKGERYAEAIDPCQRALDKSANADVQAAYDEAKAAVKAEAQAAATKAAAESLSGKPADESAKGALEGAAKNLMGGE